MKRSLEVQSHDIVRVEKQASSLAIQWYDSDDVRCL